MSPPLHVLVVEDSVDDVLLIQRALSRAGLPVETTRVETEASMRAALSDGSFDLILSDHSLPQFSSTRALQILTELEQDIPFVIVSGSIGEEAAVEAMRRGCKDYVSKDNLRRLAVVVEREVADAAERRARKAAESALWDSETRFRQLVDHAPVGILSCDRRGQIHTVNQRLIEILGSPTAEATRAINMLTFPLLVEAGVAELARRCLETGYSGTSELPYTTHWGKDLYLRFHFAPLRDVSGEIHGLQAVVEDITERKEAEAERALLATAIEQAAEVIMITDASGVIEYVNPAFERITGYSRDEAVGRTPGILKSGAHDDAFYEELWSTILAGTVWTGQFINRRKDGGLYEEEAVISPIRDETGRVVKFVKGMRDVTEELRLQQRLQQAQKMEAIGTLAGGIAHDFNNLLTVLLGYTELAQGSLPSDSAAYQDLGEVLTAGLRARDLVGQILAFSRKADSERRPIELEPLVKEVLRLVRSGLPSTIEIRTNLGEHHTVVNADPTQVHQVLMNLCTNAGQAMPDGGVLEVRLQPVTLDEFTCATLDGLPPGHYACLSVRDTGHGMDVDTVTRIFEPFFTTKGVGKGTGMGLAVVHGIVKSLEGDITVYSEPGAGTQFHVYLPVIGAVAAAPPAKADPIEGGHERILLVDDEAQVRTLGRSALQQRGYAVTVCADGEEALAHLRAAGEPYQLVVTDHTMPHMTGIELAREIRHGWPTLPILLCTGYFDPGTSAAARDAGISDVLGKPYTPDVLARAVRCALDSPAPAGGPHAP